jgi:transcriptional regulator with XRE-family HTH domain
MLTPKELRSRRIALRMTAAELAAQLGLPPVTIDAWERGEEPLDQGVLSRLDGLQGEPGDGSL